MGKVDIDEKTNVPLFAVAAALPFLIGGLLWLTSIDAKATFARDQITGVIEMLRDVRERVIRIEEHQKSDPRNHNPKRGDK
jgi:hypothetical protein